MPLGFGAIYYLKLTMDTQHAAVLKQLAELKKPTEEK